MVADISTLLEENILKAYNEASLEMQDAIKSKLSDFNLSLEDLADIKQGQIAKIFGQGGGIQIQFKLSIDIYEKLGFLKEVIK